MPDLFDPNKDHSDYYTHYPKAKKGKRIIFAILYTLLAIGIIWNVDYYFGDLIRTIWDRLWK
jgi:hypothetical protein